MIGFLFFNLALLLIIVVLLLLLSMVWPPDSPWAPFWRTDKKTARAACKLANIKNNDIVYELGSGDATFLIVAAKEFKARGVGIEIDPLRYLVSNLLLYLNKLRNNVEIKRENFFNVNLTFANFVFVYLVPKALERLKPKFLKELKKGTIIISYRYQMNLPLFKKDEKNKLYLYRI